MPIRTPSGRLPLETACEIVGTSANSYRNWVDADLLEPTGGQGLTELETVRLAILHALVDQLKLRDAKHAWHDVREALASRLPTGNLDLVYDLPSRAAALADTPMELAEAVRCRRPVQVVALTDEIRRVRRAIEKEFLLRRPSTVDAAEDGPA